MAARASRSRSPKRKILLLERDDVSSSKLCQYISERGHKAICAATSEEAMRLLHDTVYIGSSFDALLADYHLNDGSALRIIRDFRSEFKAATVGLMSNQDDIATAIWARSKGIPVLDKPIREPELIAWLNGVELRSA